MTSTDCRSCVLGVLKSVGMSTYPIKAVCEVGPAGKKCHGTPEGADKCTGMVYFEQLSADECKISWDIKGAGKAGPHGFHIHEKVS